MYRHAIDPATTTVIIGDSDSQHGITLKKAEKGAVSQGHLLAHHAATVTSIRLEGQTGSEPEIDDLVVVVDRQTTRFLY